jgi:hypothetical protein
VPEERKIAGDTSVNASTPRLADASIPRHAQPRVAEAPAQAGAGRFTGPTSLPPVARATNPQPQTPLELANTAKREFEAKSKQRDDANAQLAETQPGTKERTDAESNSNRIVTEYKNAVIKYFWAWAEVFRTNPELKIAQEEFEKATALAEDVAFDVVHPTPFVDLGREPTEEEVSDYKRTHPSGEGIVQRVPAPPMDTSGGAAKSDFKPQPSTDEVVQRALAQPVDTSRGAPKPAHVATKPAGKVASLAEVKKQIAKADQFAQQKLNAARARFEAARKKLNAIDKSGPATAQTKGEALKRADELKGASDAYMAAAAEAKTAARDTGDAGKIARAEKAYTDAAEQQSIALQHAWEVQQHYKE